MNHFDESGKAFARLCQIMKQLRSPDGCPWDAEQSPETLKEYIVEETYELLEAIDDADTEQIRDELGDLLLQVVFQATIFSERGCFNATDVANAISDKLIRRHPHVFADAEFTDEADLHRQWDAIKSTERKISDRPNSAMAGIPKSLPALQYAQKMLVRASRRGLPMENPHQAHQEVAKQLAEIDQNMAEDRDSLSDRIGNLLMSVVGLAHSLGTPAEDCLRITNRRFATEFDILEQDALKLGNQIEDLPTEQVALFWKRAKNDGC